MNNKAYVHFVNSGKYPDDPIVPLPDNFVNDAGVIQNLMNAPVGGVALITSKKGSERSNHYHLEDNHYLYVVSGSMEYYERGLDEVFTGKPLVVTAGQMVFTP